MNYLQDSVGIIMARVWLAFGGVGSRMNLLYPVAIIILLGAFEIFTKQKYVKAYLFSFKLTTASNRCDAMFMLLHAMGLITLSVFGLDPELIARLELQSLVSETQNQVPASFMFMSIWALTGLLFQDFLRYWLHRLQHQFRLIWVFHLGHHSIEDITIYSGWKNHPVDIFFVRFGSLLGYLLYLKVSLISFPNLQFRDMAMTVFAIQFIYFFSFYARHSKVWIHFPRTLSYVFISPAMHLVHHGRDPKYSFKNFGVIYSIWDWMFNTLYIPDRRDEKMIVFGVHDKLGIKNESLWSSMSHPFTLFARELIALYHRLAGKGFKQN